MTKKEQITQWVTKNPPSEGQRGFYTRVAKRFGTTSEYVRHVVKPMMVPNIVDNIQAKRSKRIMKKAFKQVELGGVVYSKKELEKIIGESESKRFGFDIPESKEYIVKHTTIPVGNFKVGIINDVHFPYHSKKNLNIALEQMVKAGVDKLILNGDMVDFYGISRFSTTPDMPMLKDELAMAIDCMNQLRINLPDAEMFYKVGNHENRLYRYLTDRAAGLWGLDELSLTNLFKLKDNNIKFVDDHEFILIGDLTVMHGHELGVSTAGMNVANTMFKRYLGSLCFGHFHKTQDFYRTIATGVTQQSHGIGALCDLAPQYRPYNDWNAGFAIVEFDSSGEYMFNNYRIEKDKILNVWPH
jgi:predicted phosphodiesterase